MKNILIKCFGQWWVYDQSEVANPPLIASDILELADIVYYPSQEITIKNRHNEPFEGAITMRLWLSNEIQSIESDSFRDAYVEHVTGMARIVAKVVLKK